MRPFGKHVSLSLIAILLVLLSACGSEAPSAPTAPTAGTPTASPLATTPPAATNASTPTAAPSAPTPTEASAGPPATAAGAASSGPTDYSQVGPELAAAFAGQYKGTTVTLNSNCVSDPACANTFKDFQAKTGITVKLVPPGDQAGVVVKIQSGTIEDIVDFTNPGFLTTYAQAGQVVDLNQVVNHPWLQANLPPGFLETNTVAGPHGPILAGLFTYINFKSAVWYPKQAFDAAGYKPPQTWAELQSLMDQIVADGDPPWCIGIASGGATGWPATDWIEDILLRTTSAENYDKWTHGQLPFTDPIVKNAFQILTNIWFNDKYVYGGRKTIVSTNFLDAPNPMFDNPPKCWLHKQANFITVQSFQKNHPQLQSGVDYDFFYFPPIDPQYGKPVLFAGDFFTMFHDRPEVRAVLQYTATYDWIKPWIQAGGEAISPLKSSNLADYTTDTYRKMAQTILQATTVRFDGSDLMPAPVGAGSFWKGITDYVSGAATLDQALTTIQNGWKNVQK